jgi:hypothetical protein
MQPILKSAVSGAGRLHAPVGRQRAMALQMKSVFFIGSFAGEQCVLTVGPQHLALVLSEYL